MLLYCIVIFLSSPYFYNDIENMKVLLYSNIYHWKLFHIYDDRDAGRVATSTTSDHNWMRLCHFSIIVFDNGCHPWAVETIYAAQVSFKEELVAQMWAVALAVYDCSSCLPHTVCLSYMKRQAFNTHSQSMTEMEEQTPRCFGHIT